MISVSLQCKIVSLGEQQEKRDFKRQQPQQPAQSFYLSPNQIRSWQLGAVINELYNSYPNITNEGTFEIDGIIDKVLRDIYEQKTDGDWGWNSHQFHRRTEFFSDFGNYKSLLQKDLEIEDVWLENGAIIADMPEEEIADEVLKAMIDENCNVIVNGEIVNVCDGLVKESKSL